MLKIRLKRIGRKKEPFYKIVITNSLSKRNGKPFREIGYYNPLKKNLYIDKNTLYRYLNLGAYPTNAVRHLIYKILD